MNAIIPNSEPRLTSVPVVGQDFFETNTIQVPARASAEAPIITPESNSILEENAAIFKQRSGSAEKSFIQEVSSRGENYDRGAGLEYNPGKESDDAQTILFQLAIKHEVIIAEQDPELREQLLESYADSSTVIYDRVKPTSANFVPTADLVISETPTYYTDNFADVPADGSPTKAIVAYNLIAEPTETGRVDTFAYVVKLVNEDWKIMKLLKPQDSAASKSLIDKIDNSASYTWE
ncbi:MAG: hypothetical protein EOO17_04945 [Chloroflexi bacterium]|nr:MAG: hypothetical protein EOO17_04945 [Chloroflexota bacterium]